MAALVLVGLCVFVMRRTRRMPALPDSTAAAIAETAAADKAQATEHTPRGRAFRRAILAGKTITGAAAFLALLLCIRGAWGSGNYYAGGFVVNGALAVVLLAVVVSVLPTAASAARAPRLASRTERHQELIARRAGSSTKE